MRGEALLLNIPSVFPMSAAGQALSVDAVIIIIVIQH